MASQPPIVPSKNALRALRRLALSPPTIIVGAIGSICGVATLNYETRRRVHLAEQIVETKRILRSVSSGTASARLNEMFEAAERGDDFTLQAQHAKKRKKRNGARHFSTAAATRPTQEDESNTAQQVLHSREQDSSHGHSTSHDHGQINLLKGHKSIPHGATQAAEGIKQDGGFVPSADAEFQYRTTKPDSGASKSISGICRRVPTAKSLHLPKSSQAHAISPSAQTLIKKYPSQGRRQPKKTEPEMSDIEKYLLKQGLLPSPIAKETGKEMDQEDRRSGSQPSCSSDAHGTYVNHIAQDLQPSKHASHATPRTTYSLGNTEGDAYTHFATSENSEESQSLLLYPELNEFARSHHTSPIRHYLPPYMASAVPLSRSCVRWHSVKSNSLSAEETRSSDLKAYILGRADSQRNQAAWPSYNVYDFGDNDTDRAVDEALKIHLRHARKFGGYQPKPSRIFESPVPDAGSDGFKSIPHYVLDYLAKAVNPRTYLDVKNFILPVQFSSTEEEALRRWLAAMRHFTQRDSPDWAMAEALFYSFRFYFGPDNLFNPPVARLISHLLSSAPKSESIQEILFPSTVPEGTSSDVYHSLAFRYLTFFCEGNSDKACIEELAKIHKLAKRSNMGHKDNFFVPVMRKALRSEDPDQTDALMHAIETTYPQSVAPHIWGQCALWYASHGKWQDVQAMLDRIHATGYSRHRSVLYGTLYHKLLLRYLEKNNATQAFSFLVNGIKYAGLIPIHTISTTLICACVKERRFELVTEWIRLIREAFPRVKLGFDLERDAWNLGQALRESGANCQAIAEVCRAVALSCRDDPFCSLFKEYVKDLVRLDLVRRMCAVSELGHTDVPTKNALRSMTLDSLLEQAYRFCTSPKPPNEIDIRFDTLSQDLADQLNAVDGLMSIFNGDFSLALIANGHTYQSTAFPQGLPAARTGERPKDVMGFQQRPPEIVERYELPDHLEIAKAVADHYAMRKKKNLPVDHSLLKHLLRRLSVDRASDALELVETTYASIYVQGIDGKTFDNSIFLQWLELADVVGDVSSIARVLWAVIDSSRQLKWTFDFAALVTLVGKKYIPPTEAKGVNKWLPKHDLIYLTRRIWSIRENSSEYIGDDFRFPDWRDWEVRLRESMQASQAA
ncbi:hypothetical protein PV05_10351 [Exophiala xenobiotica]|uniref:Uncharacterized protein n=1 Tax=Exophiala xenobiotica TaxID=348802 RepID=A0A0D2BHC3_9EURO|nr:uncharacterized protein PV05_10351 [Exophiala xenobiotica]KIW51651.1 hypothetical protein PV05_10351 [Exophiala xenobiotica]